MAIRQEGEAEEPVQRQAGLIRYGRVTERAPEARDDDIAQEPLPRQLGFWSVWLLAVNGILGSGIFGLPGTATRLAGEWAQLLYLGCALLVLPVLLCFGELASRFRSTGGPATYATEAFGPFVGFQAGWLFYVARVVSVSAGSVLLVDSLAYFWPAANVGPTRVALIAAVIFGFVLITTIGSGQAIRALGSLTVLKFGVLLGLVAAGAPAALGGLATPPATTPETLDLGRATVLLIFAYVGFESAVVPGGEARRPERDMAWALLLSLGLVGLLYLAVQWVSRSVLPDLASSSTPLLDVAAVLLGPTGALLLMAGVACSLLGSLAGATFSTPRITYAFALDGRLPAWFGRVHPTFRTPANSIVVYGGLAFLLAVGGTFAGLAVASVFMRLLMYIVVCACVPVLRRASRAASPFAVPGGVLVPVLGVLTSGWLLQQVDLEAVLIDATGATGARRERCDLVAGRMDPGRVDQARRQADRTRFHGLVHEAAHRCQFANVGCPRRGADRHLAHRAVPDQRGHVHRRAGRVEPIEEVREVYEGRPDLVGTAPCPRCQLDGRRQRERRHAAVAHDHGRHALTEGRGHRGMHERCGVGVVVHIDEAGCEHQPAGIDPRGGGSASAVRRPLDGRDDPVVDAHRRRVRGLARPVDHQRRIDPEVEHATHRSGRRGSADRMANPCGGSRWASRRGAHRPHRAFGTAPMLSVTHKGYERKGCAMSNDDRLSLVLFSGTDDKLQAASVLTVGAAAMSRPVDVFLQYWALDAFRADRITKDHGVSPEAGPEGARAMYDHGKTHWSELLRQAKDLGDVRIQACSDSMEMFHITADDLDPLVDGVWGVASFFMEADGSVTFI
jgi:amino acid transporter/peroxiredoxin family protein